MKQFGGEFKLIDHLDRLNGSSEFMKGMGDDGALMQLEGTHRLVLTKELLVEGRHFCMETFTAEQVGVKAMETTLSDLAAMGARPVCVLVGLGLRPSVTVGWVEGFYGGLWRSARSYGVEITGGDTVMCRELCLSLTAIGSVMNMDGDRKYLRSDAKVGDRIKVTGSLGKAAVGYELLRLGIGGYESLKRSQREPKARFDVLDALLGKAHAMIDISDGLVGDLRHVCEASEKGAVLYEEKIPMDTEMILASEEIGKKPLEMALYGGEDYELLYTVSAGDVRGTPGVEIGEITAGDGIVFSAKDGTRDVLHGGGFDHFKELGEIEPCS